MNTNNVILGLVGPSSTPSSISSSDDSSDIVSAFSERQSSFAETNSQRSISSSASTTTTWDDLETTRAALRAAQATLFGEIHPGGGNNGCSGSDRGDGAGGRGGAERRDPFEEIVLRQQLLEDNLTEGSTDMARPAVQDSSAATRQNELEGFTVLPRRHQQVVVLKL